MGGISPVQIGGVSTVRVGGVLRRFPSPKFRSQQGAALQMRGVLRYKLEIYRQCFSDKLYGLGGAEQFPMFAALAVFSLHPVGEISGTLFQTSFAVSGVGSN